MFCSEWYKFQSCGGKNEIAKWVTVLSSFTEATFVLIAYISSNEPHTKKSCVQANSLGKSVLNFTDSIIMMVFFLLESLCAKPWT